MVKASLDSVSAQVHGCRMVAYADLSSMMVLMTSGDAVVNQDALALLCAQADSCLQSGDLAVIATSTETRVFLRSLAESDDALVCVCAPDGDIANLIPAGRACLAQIAKAGTT